MFGHEHSMTVSVSHSERSPVIIQIITGVVAANIMMGLSFFLLPILTVLMMGGPSFGHWHIAGIGVLYAAIVLTVAGVVFYKARARSSHSFAWTWIICVALDLILLLIGWALLLLSDHRWITGAFSSLVFGSFLDTLGIPWR